MKTIERQFVTGLPSTAARIAVNGLMGSPASRVGSEWVNGVAGIPCWQIITRWPSKENKLEGRKLLNKASMRFVESLALAESVPVSR